MTLPSAGPGTVIEPMRWWDIPAVTELELVLFPEDSPWTPAMFWSELANGHHYVVVRGVADRVLGYAGLAITDDLAQVQTIGVDPGARRRGIGAAMLDHLVATADGRRIMLEVRTDNDPAICLYDSRGFHRIGLRRRYYRPSGADAYTMQRPDAQSRTVIERGATEPKSSTR